jgi:hypothetical protein
MKIVNRFKARPLLPAIRIWLMAVVVSTAVAQEMRIWTNQEGRTVKAGLVELAGADVVLQLENGTRTRVAVAALSKADQDWLQNRSGAATAPVTPGLKWPAAPVGVDPKSLTVTMVKEDAAARRYHYQSGVFEFITTAPLAGSVMSEVAADFEVIRESFRRMPWGWEANPKPGQVFTIYLLETDADYLAMGGDDRSSASSKDDKTFIKFSALGLKKVGAKYQYDARQKEPGRVAGVTARVMFWEVRGRMAPWALNSIESSMRFVNYQSNGSMKFTGLESDLKKMVKKFEGYDLTLSASRMLKYLRDTWSTRDSTFVTQFLLERQLDSQLLLYYFGYLDGDGSGAGMHRYFRGIFDEARKGRKTSETYAQELLQELLAGRSDDQLKAEMTAKFAAIGLKLAN